MREVTIGRPPIYVYPDGREELLQIHNQFITSKKKRKIFVAHRRGRKTSTCLSEVFKFLVSNKGIIGKTLAPIRKQAKEIIWDDPDMLFSIVPPEVVANVNASELKITLKNGSLWYLDGADQPDFQRGGNVKVLHLTECGDHREEVWSSIYEPVLMLNKGIGLFEGNPRGQNWFHKLYVNAGDRPDWDKFLVSCYDTPIFTKEQLDDIKSHSPENVWKAEYLCEWVGSNGMVFRSIRQACKEEPQEALIDRKYRFGLDLGRLVDYTVLSGVDRHTWNQVRLERFNKVDWGLIKQWVKEIIMEYSLKETGNAVELVVESNSVGDPIINDLYRWTAEVKDTHNITIVPFTTTNASKELLVSNFSMLTDQSIIKLLKDEKQIEEFEAFSYQRSRLHFIYGAPSGMHDDIVMATMIAYWNLGGKLPIPITREKQKFLAKYQSNEDFVEDYYLQ